MTDLLARDEDHFSLFHHIIRFNAPPQLVSLLLDLAAQSVVPSFDLATLLAARTKHGMTPLHIAAVYNKSLDVVKLLAEKRPASLVERSVNKQTPLDACMEMNAGTHDCAGITAFLESETRAMRSKLFRKSLELSLGVVARRKRAGKRGVYGTIYFANLSTDARTIYYVLGEGALVGDDVRELVFFFL